MYILKNPEWIDFSLQRYQTLDEVPEQVFESINNRLIKIIDNNPVVSILIAAWNEECNIIRCIDSLSKTETNIPFDITVINNNSSDKTQDSIDRLEINTLFQKRQGCGPSRQLGQEKAKGKYILLADADCLYPPNWIDEMMRKLTQPSIVCVYGRYSFLAETKSLRLKLFFYERLKDIISEIRHWKRPYINCLGISMGYLKESGLKAKYIDHNTWGDDGRLAFDMMKDGKIVQMKKESARVWTGYRSLMRDGSLKKAFFTRVLNELANFSSYFSRKEEHDTKTSKNPENDIQSNISEIKKKIGLKQ